MKKLNFGCGRDIKKGWDNCDIQKEAPISFDFNKFPYPLKKDYYDYIFIRAVLEELDNPAKTILELREKTKKGEVIEIIAPYWNSKGIWNCPRSKRGFNEMFFDFLTGNSKWDNFTLIKKENFKIEELELVPTNVGRWVPRWLREKLSTFISGMIMHIRVKYKVIKD